MERWFTNYTITRNDGKDNVSIKSLKVAAKE